MLPLKISNVKLNLNKREKVLASLFLLMAAFFLYYHYVFVVQEKKIAAIKKDIKSKEAMIDQLIGQGYGNVSQLTARIQEMDAEIGVFHRKVPNAKNSPGLLVDFYQSAKENKVTAQTIVFGKLEAKDNCSSFLVSLDVLGAKRDVFNFIKEIESYPRLSKISKIEFEPGEGNMILAKISDQFYVLHDVKPDHFAYPFMEGRRGSGALTGLFNQYKVPGQVEQSANPVESSNNPVPQTDRAGNTSEKLIPNAAGNTGGNKSGGWSGISK
jgi:Tfp pilus assembly protein PilO